MKAFTIILLFCLQSVVSLQASTEPTKKSDHTRTTFVVTMDTKKDDVKALYTEQDDHLSFQTEDAVSIIQVFDANFKVVYQMTVDSKNVKLGKSLFEKGDYTLGFILSNQNSLKFTKVKVL